MKTQQYVPIKPNVVLSKSKMKQNEDCSLMLWNELHHRKEKVWDANTMHTFEQGRIVEQVARNQFPNAVLQDLKDNWEKVVYTKELLKNDAPIFEAAFAKRGAIVQFDVLSKKENGHYNAVEVKSSGEMKPDYETDVIIQYWIATLSGLKIDRFELWFVNKSSTSISDNFFVKQDVTELVRSNERRFWELLSRSHKTKNGKSAPEVKMGPQCKKLDCPYQGSTNCTLVKNADSVHSLPRFTKAWEAYHEGITSVNDERFDQNYKKYADSHKIVIQAVRENRLVINHAELLKEYSGWKFPLNMFDFETIMSAIPVLAGQTPYAQMVFQFSNHVYDGQSNQLKQFMFLHDNDSNPNMPVIEAMLNCLESNEGSIVAWNEGFEKGRIKALAEKYPLYAERLNKLVERFVDLMVLVKNHVYHPGFMGSYSLKPVSASLLNEYGSYTDSVIKSGSEIAKIYIEMITTKDMERKEVIKNALIKYCSYDTLNLFLVLRFILDPSVNLKELVDVNLGLTK